MNLRVDSMLSQYLQRDSDIFQELFYQQYYPGIQYCYATLLEVFLCQRASVLDIRSGLGDIALHLAHKEHSVLSLAQTQRMVDYLRARQVLSQSTMQFRVGDIMHLDIPERFNVVVAHNALGTVLREQECVQTFQNVHKHLLEYGVCVFDFFTEHAFTGNPLQEVTLLTGHPPNRSEVQLKRAHRVFAQERAVLCDWHIAAKNYQEQLTSTMRFFSPDDVAEILKKAGFAHVRFFDISVSDGTSTINELKDMSRLAVCVARKVSFEDNSNRFADEEE